MLQKVIVLKDLWGNLILGATGKTITKLVAIEMSKGINTSCTTTNNYVLSYLQQSQSQ